jgi:hypothetical protein
LAAADAPITTPFKKRQKVNTRIAFLLKVNFPIFNDFIG